jgi:hypothetical protein
VWDGPTGELTYSGLRVIEIAQDPQGEIVGKLLADQGADVIKVEPPGGATGRHIGPYAAGHEGDLDHSLHFWTYNTGKSSVVLDSATRRGAGSASSPDRERRCRDHQQQPRRTRRRRDRSGGAERPAPFVDCRLRLALWPHRSLGRPSLQRPGGAGCRRHLDELRLRRSLTPARTPWRQSGLPDRSELRPPRAVARAARTAGHGAGAGRRCLHARGRGGQW